ncbi:rod shape-determining protein MreD [Helicovermis profundi]|uniref:Rod shape-determining protein MreD n=1 Tax=Helicovermis profundi TaxID=3065157 RepID=A0AAU9EGP7_9FIRM|nr:hypothetical protein HLPR_22580 [Clostridia bacterium S502]
MKSKYVILISIFVFLIQSTILQFFRIYGIIPNISLVMIVTFTLIYGKKEGYIFAIGVGILQDVFLSKALSINLIIYTSIVFIISLFYEKLFKDNFLTPIITIIFATFIYHIMFLLFMYLIGASINDLDFYKIILGEGIENIVIITFIYGKIFPRVYDYNMR